MHNSIHVRKNNKEATIDDLSSLSSYNQSRRTTSTGRDRIILALVCFAWQGPNDLSQAEFIYQSGTNKGTGTGAFAYVNSTYALLNNSPTIFGQVVWECILIGYGIPKALSVGGSGFGPLTYDRNMPILMPIRPRFDFNVGTVCNYMAPGTGSYSTNLYPVATFTGYASGVTTTLGGTAYVNTLPGIGAIDGNGVGHGSCFSYFKKYVVPAATTVGGFNIILPQYMPDVGDTNIRWSGSGNTIEGLEYFRCVVYGGQNTSGTDNGLAITWLDTVCRNMGSSVTVLNNASISGGYAVTNPVTPPYTINESSQFQATLYGQAYISGSYTISLQTFSLTFHFDAFGRVTSASTSGGTGLSSPLLIGGQP